MNSRESRIRRAAEWCVCPSPIDRTSTRCSDQGSGLFNRLKLSKDFMRAERSCRQQQCLREPGKTLHTESPIVRRVHETPAPVGFVRRYAPRIILDFTDGPCDRGRKFQRLQGDIPKSLKTPWVVPIQSRPDGFHRATVRRAPVPSRWPNR